ncbi:hypothetical protein ACFL1H_04420 [Nanoarchaeota archaeon]
MDSSFSLFLKKELMEYINQEIEKGYTIETIANNLLRGGHNKNLVDEAIMDLNKHNFNIINAMREPLKLRGEKRELYFDLLNSIIKYIEKQLEEGRSLNEIKEILLDYGHSKKTIDSAIKKVTQGETVKIFSNMAILKFIGLSMGIIVLLFLTSGATEEPLSLVFFGFFPTIVMLLVGYVLRMEKTFLLVMPFLLSLIFYLLGTQAGVEMFTQMDVGTLTFINLILSLLIGFILMEPKKEEIVERITIEEENKGEGRERILKPRLVKMKS